MCVGVCRGGGDGMGVQGFLDDTDEQTWEVMSEDRCPESMPGSKTTMYNKMAITNASGKRMCEPTC